MIKKSLSVLVIAFVLFLFGCGTKDIVPPKVTATNPQNGAQSIDPSLTEIWVTFDEPMMDKSWAWCYEEKNSFPQTTGDPSYNEDLTKCVLPVKLEPNKEYVIWINMTNMKDFKDKAGNPAEPYKFTFRTK
jgi:hypothetical protein